MRAFRYLILLISVGLVNGCGNSQFAGGAGAGSTSKNKGGKKTGTDDPNAVFKNTDPNKQPPKFGLLVNDLRCSFCHLQVRGDVVSLSDVKSLWGNSVGWVQGNWTLTGTWTPNTCSPSDGCTKAAETPNVTVTGDNKPKNSDSTLYPRDPSTGAAVFPQVDWAAAKSSSKQKYETSSVLLGTEASPIDVTGDVYVEGDLIIKGKYKGAGTIYVSGNVYIPANLTAMQSPFPFADDPATALAEAKKALEDKKDGLAIASAKSIVIGAFEKRLDTDNNTSVFTHGSTSLENTATSLGLVSNNKWLVYDWYSKTEFDSLWDATNPAPNQCTNARFWPVNTPTVPPMNKYISRIDAFLYAVKTIGGRANNSSYAINGGIIADHFHVITAAGKCSESTHPVHGYKANKSHINYDWRLQAGLGLLTHMGQYFKAK